MNCNSKTERQYNGQKKQEKQTNKGLQSTTQKTWNLEPCRQTGQTDKQRSTIHYTENLKLRTMLISLAFFTVLCRLLFVLLSLGHCMFCLSSIYGFWLSLWYIQTYLYRQYCKAEIIYCAFSTVICALCSVTHLMWGAWVAQWAR